MTYDEIFEAMYNLYRAEADTPANDDDEYTIGMRLANEAINRWANYDGTYWRELFENGSITSTGVLTYTAPSDMREAGGLIRIGSNYTPILNPEEAQFRSTSSNFAFFTGNPSNGYTLNFNTAPETGTINFVYYKQPTNLESGSDTTEMANPYFIVHRMLAQRFRASRNYSGYQTAMRDAEDALKIMKMDNDSGTWANPWKLADNSGAVWGQDSGGGFAW